MTPGWRRAGWIAAAVLVVLGVVAATVPLWLRPLVAAQASAALGRTVTIERLAVGLPTLHPVRLRLRASGITIAGTADTQEAPSFATIARLVADIDPGPLLRFAMPAVPHVSISGLEITAVQSEAGARNFVFILPPGNHGAGLAIGDIELSDSHAHIVLHPAALDMQIALRTEGGANPRIIGEASGTYQDQPVTGRLIGGALTGLRNPGDPYEVDIRLASGKSHVAFAGTVRNPLDLEAADVNFELAGQDMQALFAVTGIPFPPTPPYRITSRLAYGDAVFHLTNIVGRVGSSDVDGTLDIDTTSPHPVVSGSLRSRRADLEDLGGFIGSQPGRPTTPELTPAQRQAVVAAVANPRLIPNREIDLPKIQAADFHITYRADSIVGQSVPFDSISTRLDIKDGGIAVNDFHVGVGRGQAQGRIEMSPVGNNFHTVAEIRLINLDVRRMLASTHLISGSGALGGELKLESTGRSLGEILSHANGRLTLFMAGGTASELLIDLSGLQLGEALLAALGLPERTSVRCLIGDLALVNGTLEARTLLLDTASDRTMVAGKVNLQTEAINAALRTWSKRFTVGSLPAPIAITGTLKAPRFAPELAEAGARGAGAAGLGLVFPPLALLPTIQLGIGEDNACTRLVGTPSRAPAKQ